MTWITILRHRLRTDPRYTARRLAGVIRQAALVAPAPEDRALLAEIADRIEGTLRARPERLAVIRGLLPVTKEAV
jgi:hypothetical protein